MKIFNVVLKMTAVLVVVLGFTGCAEDYTTIGSDIIGDNNFTTSLYEETDITVTNQNLDAVQTNLLPGNLLGVYNDPVYGQKTASILTQISLPESTPTFGVEPVLDSVILTIPYYSTRLAETGENGEAMYELDSVYGSDPFKLQISRSNLFLNDYDPDSDFQQRQKFYSDQEELINNNLGQVLYTEDNFIPSSEAIQLITGTGDEIDTTYTAPALRIKFTGNSLNFFIENIINKEGTMELMNNNNFKNFIRGLYFEAEPIGDSGNMLLLDFANENAGISLFYTHQVEDDIADTDETVPEQSIFTLNFSGIKYNTFSSSFTLPDNDNIYLSGGAGTMAVIELFTEEQLEELKANNWLINEASLTFFVNQDVVSGGASEPRRIYLYDLENNVPLIDYERDFSATTLDTDFRGQHLGVLQRDESGNGISYKIKLTDHISKIINEDSTNVKLGLVVASNVGVISMTSVKNNEEIEKVPATSVLTPKGTVLYGPDAAVEAKKLKLSIYYTETE
ncbi:MAG TPA: DUF4270 domain-containing protein [Salinimicrobium sp.]|nr:DUF4270 domain-containing protein [Salinimicrobium sp.]